MDKAPLTVDFHPIPTNLLPEPANCAHMCFRASRSALTFSPSPSKSPLGRGNGLLLPTVTR
ncbi:unnamed protein product [Clonostachys rosea f. rosea IK726]|uniref:Uncharacterized protein n=1 Tax=Clonostachys rosea f. rosea IK726 TaxID=1349383 RepID=A0ACA9UD23_BIOOC|nr:unnamed protein product [Clonostachys rosea f. rosea IK726]